MVRVHQVLILLTSSHQCSSTKNAKPMTCATPLPPSPKATTTLLATARFIPIIVFFFLFLGCTRQSPPQEGQSSQIDVQEFISTLSLDERFLLDYFFRCLIQEDTIGYVLLGKKPMGFY